MALLSRIPLALWLAAGLALAIWWGMSQRDRARDAEAAVRGYREAAQVADRFLRETQERNRQLMDRLEALENVSNTATSVDRSLDPVFERMRQRDRNP